jgi:hypothetical protein
MTSTAAKSVIVASTTMVDLIRDTPHALATITALASTAIPASLRSSTTAVGDPFDGIPSKVIVVGMRANNI